jgi:hypothetical protein
MQLELFFPEETVRAYEQRIAAHAERERITRLLTSPGCESTFCPRAVSQILPIPVIGAVARRVSFLWCTAIPQRWSSCTALS